MNSLYIEKISDNTIRLSKLNLLPIRFKSKLTLFLQTILKNLDIKESENEILIIYPVIDNFIIGNDLNKLLNLINQAKMEYECDDEIKNIIEIYNKSIKGNELKLDLLNNIKTTDFQNTEEFSNFKNFCDDNLKISLKDYQYKSAYLLSMSKSGFDFSVPGSGKTIITYTSYEYFKQKHNINKILVIGPKNAYNAWYDEYKTCFGLNPDFENLSAQTLDYAKSYLTASNNNHKEITFINIDKIRNLQKEIILFLSTKTCVLVIDESHKVKNPDAQSTKVALELSKFTEYKILLTGTPMPNGYEDLFTQTKIISYNYEILPYNYSQLKNFTKNSISKTQEQEIMNSLFPHYSRVSKNYLIERKELLPSKTNLYFVEMSPEQKEIYEFLNDLSANIFNSWELDFSFIMKKAIMIRKMQVSSNPKLLNKSMLSVYEDYKKDLFNFSEEYELKSEEYKSELKKLKKAGEMIDKEIASSHIGSIIKDYNQGKYIIPKNQKAVNLTKQLLLKNKKVILWDTFVENMRILKEMISNQLNISVEVINGNVVGEERQTIIDNFRDGDLKVLIASPATLAESISLHKSCQNAIYVNRNYNAAQFIQSKDRIHRINMPEGTTANYYFLINIESIDEAVNERLYKKEERMLKILDSKDIVIGDLESTDNSTMSLEDIENSYLR